MKGALLALDQRRPLGKVGVLICRRHELGALGMTTVVDIAETVEKWVTITSDFALPRPVCTGLFGYIVVGELIGTLNVLRYNMGVAGGIQSCLI